MRYALISDIHANLPALEAVLFDIAAQPELAGTWHLGDLVGYAPWPNEVVARIAEAGIPGVGGNYDSTVATDYPHCGCRYEDAEQERLSHLSYEWTRAHVTPETKRMLGALPFRIDVLPEGGHISGAPRLVMVHASPTINTLYWTEERPDDFCLKMAAHAGLKAGDVIAFGHTHKPWDREVAGIRFVNWAGRRMETGGPVTSCSRSSGTGSRSRCGGWNTIWSAPWPASGGASCRMSSPPSSRLGARRPGRSYRAPAPPQLALFCVAWSVESCRDRT